MAFGTWKPCHGCGEKTGWRPVNTLCGPCKTALQAGRGMKASEEDRAEKVKIYRLTPEWPGIYSPGREGRDMELAFAEVARTGMRRARSRQDPYDKTMLELPPSGRGVNYFSTHDKRAPLWVGTKRFASALTRLDRVVRETVSKVYKTGKEEGSDLLMQLARGEISVDQISNEHLKGRV